MFKDCKFETFREAICGVVSRWYLLRNDAASEHLFVDVVVLHVNVFRFGHWVCRFDGIDCTGIINVKCSWYGEIEGAEVAQEL